MKCLAAETWLRGLRRIAFASFTCVFALVGVVVGAVTGATVGHTTGTGLFRGMGIGAVAGVILSMDILNSFCNGESLSKIVDFTSLMDGKFFEECVSPAVFEAYQWQINNLESVDLGTTVHDIFDVAIQKDMMTWESVGKLPEYSVGSSKVNVHGDVNCAVCLQDFEEGERARRLPICCHMFHSCCIDPWLIGHGTCPLCRINVE